MAAIPPAGPGGGGGGGGGLARVAPADLANALHTLANLGGQINTLHTRNTSFRTALATGLQAIERRIMAITAVMPNLTGAQQALEALEHHVVAGTPSAAAVQQLQGVIDSLAHAQLQTELDALQGAVIALETAVGVPPLTQPPATDVFAPVAAYVGGYRHSRKANSERVLRSLRRKKSRHRHHKRKRTQHRRHKRRRHTRHRRKKHH